MPEIIASLGFGWVMKNLLNNDRLLAVQIGGVLMIIAAVLCYILVNEKDEEPAKAVS
jgi:maltose/moltooligosaccharide transporter